MAEVHSFQEFVKDKCDNRLIDAAAEYVRNNWQELELHTHRVNSVGEVRFSYANIKRVLVRDLPELRVAFEVIMDLELELVDANARNDETDEDYPWIRVYCEGDLANGLDDWQILRIEPCSKQNPPQNTLSDALVPRIDYADLEKVAQEFLEKYYPEALVAPKNDERPTPVEPDVLASRLGLTIQIRDIKEDASVYGQLFFRDADVELYNSTTHEMEMTHIPEKTILVDPSNAYLRNLGSQNNTIIHECVHWVKHRKVFELEKLYNNSATSISCEVVGNASSRIASQATKQMESQANQLAPRIQMPAGPFKAKANQYIREFMQRNNTNQVADVMENVITQLETDFVVSRQAAKIRLVELGFEEAIGTFTYVDGHYVRPHSFKRGAIRKNQTFTISKQDAAIQRFSNLELRELTTTGNYLFVENHYVFNDPKYLEACNDDLMLTDYARTHMDECCLVFDMHITGCEADYSRTACFLNRIDPMFTMEYSYTGGLENNFRGGQEAHRQAILDEAIDLTNKMTNDSRQCFDLILDYAEMTQKELAKAIGINEKTVGRIADRESYTDYKTGVAMCLALRLHPVVSKEFLKVLGVSPQPGNTEHMWLEDALHTSWMKGINPVKRELAKFDVIL